MKETLEHIKFNNGSIPVHIFEPNVKPKGVIQFIYDANENAEKNENFISSMVANGFTVICADHLDHGKNNNTLPFKENFFDANKNIQLRTLINLNNATSLPVYVIGQGYGGYLALGFMQNYHFNASGVILSGVGDFRNLKNKLISKCLKLKSASYKHAYNVNMENEIYFCTVIEEVETEAKVKDIKFNSDTLASITKNEIYNAEKIKTNLNNSPLLLISGNNDKQTNNGDDTLKLYSKFKKAGINCNAVIVPNCSHSALSKIDPQTKTLVLSDVVSNFLLNAKNLRNNKTLNR